jgi:deoxyribodipyrimidine photo-lyase
MIAQSSTQSPSILWFRNDLRLADNPALMAAVARGAPVVCVYVLPDEKVSSGVRSMGAAIRWWLAGSLRALRSDLRSRGADLVVLRGNAALVLPALAEAVGAGAVFWNRRYARAETEIDATIKAQFVASGIEARSFNAHLLNEPWAITSKAGGPMKVYTPYWRAVLAKGEPEHPHPAPPAISGFVGHVAGSMDVDSLGLEPTSPDWAGGMRAEWTRGEAGAKARLERFLDQGLDGYGEARNRPDRPSTSKLSPHLRFGEISIRQCWHAAQHAHASGSTRASDGDLEVFLKELVWREFSYHLLHHNPELATANYSPRFDAFPWADDAAALKSWQRGLTGYPIVDAGMRELYETGWMHNRVRMIVGSFLVKHLLTDWRRGEEWFWDTLVDADPASNAASWQWVAGSGADAAPYFRIFNPIIQGEKFDPDGVYVRKWVPELAKLPNSVIHKPWTAPPMILGAAGVKLGQNYPRPVIQHELARDRALGAFKSLKGLTEA